MLLSLAYNFTVAVYTHLNQIFDHTLRFSVGILRTELQKGVHCACCRPRFRINSNNPLLSEIGVDKSRADHRLDVCGPNTIEREPSWSSLRRE